MSHLLKPVAFALFALTVGIWLGQKMQPASSPPLPNPPSQAEAKLKVLKEKFEVLSRVDLEEYLALKKAKEKYQKADEILGKAILIFLADLGIRVSPKQKEFAKSALEKVPKQKAPLKVSKTETRPTAKTMTEVPDWQRAESRLANIEEPREIRRLLKDTQIKDFAEAAAGAVSVGTDDPIIRRINGLFEGPVQLEKERWWASLKLLLFGASKELRGYFQLKLRKNGKVFSNQTGNGLIKDIKKFAGKSSALLVKAGGGSLYFQLHYLPRLDEFVGNLYEQSSPGQFQPTGTVRLRRTDQLRS